MEINDVSYQPGGVFTFAHLRGVTNHLPKGTYKSAILKEGGAEALIHHYLRKGGAQIDGWEAHNRLTNGGLFILVNLVIAGGHPLPDRMQLGSGSTGAWQADLPACRTPITTGGLAEVLADDRTQETITVTGDTYRLVEDFTSTATHSAGTTAPDEVCIRSASTVKSFCYATFSERALVNTDHLIVTYNLKLVP